MHVYPVWSVWMSFSVKWKVLRDYDYSNMHVYSSEH
jgi:hypothetical protein